MTVIIIASPDRDEPIELTTPLPPDEVARLVRIALLKAEAHGMPPSDQG